MAEAWRLFIAIELPSELLAALGEIQDRLKDQAPRGVVRWVAPQGIHLTLKFLGDVPLAQRDAVRDALAAAVQGHGPFELSAGGLGCFPNTRRPRVVWVGLHETDPALGALRDAVEAHVAPLGYPTEDRPFSPHLTLGRVRPEANRDDAARLGALVERAPAETLYRWTVDGVSLMRSELLPAGAVYTQVAHLPLVAAS